MKFKGGEAMNNLVDEMKNRLPEIIDVIKTVVEHESPSDEKDAIDKLINYLMDLCESKGMTTEVINNQNRGNHLLVEHLVDNANKNLLILCHIDTVWPLGTLEKIPFSNQDGVLRGPGVYDMKTGAVQAIFAVEEAIKRGKVNDKNIRILFNSDEEIGSQTSRKLIEDLARQSDCTLVLEPSVPPQGALKTFRKGVGRFDLFIKGKASHSGSAPKEGISAITELAHQILDLNGLAKDELGTTVNVGTITGGSKTNVVAANATATIDVRVETMEEAERITEDILNRKSFIVGTTVKATGGINRPPMIRSEKTIEMFNLARDISTDLGFDLQEASTGGGSDGNFTAALGVPTIDGLGSVGNGAHADTEHTLVEHIPNRTALLIRLLEEL